MTLELATISSRHQVYLEGLKTREAKEFEKFLREIDRVVAQRLSTKDLTRFTRKRLENLIVSVRKDIASIMGDHAALTRKQWRELAKYESGFEVRSLEEVFEHTWAVPSVAHLMTVVKTHPLSIPGFGDQTILEPFLKGVSRSAQTQVGNVIRQGFYQGLQTNQILQNVRGTRAAGFTDGILSRINHDARTIVRTSLQHVSNQSRQAVWEANSDVVKKVRIVATLDSRTSSICRSLDGEVYPLREGPRPPFHPNCRTTTSAVLDGRLSSLREGATRFSRGPDGVSYVPATSNYYGWLKRQPAKFQDSVIGPTRGRLLRSGGLSSERFQELQLGRNFKPLTLEQMRKLEPVAFDKANL